MAARHRRNVLAIVLAGGEGKRLMPLTADRAKPAVPFAGIYRLIDFALSNVVNSGYLKIVVLTQYKSHSLDRHVTQTWRMSTMLGNYVAPVPAQQRVGKHWYLGSADAIFQSLNLMNDEKPDIVVVVGADHVYRMDFSQMVDQHIDSGAACTVAAIRQPISLADQFGVIDVHPHDPTRSATSWRSRRSPRAADSPHEVLASMGNYVFDADALVEAVTADATLHGSKHDMGGDIVPAFVGKGAAGVYDFKDNMVPGSTDRDRGYWRDVGTMASTTPPPGRRLAAADLQPLQLRLADLHVVRAAAAGEGRPGADGQPSRTDETLLSPGVVITAARSTGPSSRRRPGRQRRDRLRLGADARCPRRCRGGGAQRDHRQVVDIPDGTRIGVDHEHDRARGFMVEDGLTILGKEQSVEG